MPSLSAKDTVVKGGVLGGCDMCLNNSKVVDLFSKMFG